MGRLIGVLVAERIAAGLVEDHSLVGEFVAFPETDDEVESLRGVPAEELVEAIASLVRELSAGERVDGVGIGFAGVVRNGKVLEAPNLPQMKGNDLGNRASARLAELGVLAPVVVLNDADAVAAGVAARLGHLERFVRVWTLGLGVGFGRFPKTDGAGEGGHVVVSLDPKEQYCGCGGIGHVEGVMGHRAMRLRFLDLEPEEIFERAEQGDTRCADFVVYWHRALAAATATSVHLEGPGRFFVCGRNARFVRPEALQVYLNEMVKMSALQGSSVEVVHAGDEDAILGAAVSAGRVLE